MEITGVFLAETIRHISGCDLGKGSQPPPVVTTGVSVEDLFPMEKTIEPPWDGFGYFFT